MGRKLGAAVPLFRRGQLGPHVTQYGMAWAEAYPRTKWHLDPYGRFATTDMGRKLGAVSLLGGEAGSPSNSMWPGPSFILIHPTVWPQYTNVTDRQTDRQTDDGLIAQGEPFYKRSPKKFLNSTVNKFKLSFSKTETVTLPYTH